MVRWLSLLLVWAVVAPGVSCSHSGSYTIEQGATVQLQLDSNLNALCKNSGFKFYLYTACSTLTATSCDYSVLLQTDDAALQDETTSLSTTDSVAIADGKGKGSPLCYTAKVTNNADGSLIILYASDKLLSCRFYEKAQGVFIFLSIPFIALFVMYGLSRPPGSTLTSSSGGTAALQRPEHVAKAMDVSADYMLIPSFDELINPDCAFGAADSSSQMPVAVKWMLTAFAPWFMLALFSVLALMMWPCFHFNKKLNARNLLFSYLRSFFWSLLVLYVPISLAAFEPWNCVEISGVYVLDKYPTIQCFHENWEWILMCILSAFCILLHVLGIPGLFITVLVLAFKNGVHEQMHFLQTFGFLFNRYEDKYRWYEVVEMTIKLSIVLSRLFLGAVFPLAFLSLLIIILSIDLVLKCLFRPYAKNWEDILAITVTVANFNVGVIAMYSGITTYVDFTNYAADIVLACVLLLTIAWVLLTAVFVFLFAGCIEEWQDKREFNRKKRKAAKMRKNNEKRVYDVSEKIVEEDNSDDERADLNMKKKKKKDDELPKESNPFDPDFDIENGKEQLDPVAKVHLFLNSHPEYLELSRSGVKDDVFLSLVTHYEFLVENRVDPSDAVEFVKVWEKFFRDLGRGEKRVWRDGLRHVVEKTGLGDNLKETVDIVSQTRKLWQTNKKGQSPPFKTDSTILAEYAFVRNQLPYDPVQSCQVIFAIERQALSYTTDGERKEYRGVMNVVFADYILEPEFSEKLRELVAAFHEGKILSPDDVKKMFGHGEDEEKIDDDDVMIVVDGREYDDVRRDRSDQLRKYYPYLTSKYQNEDDAIAVVHAWEMEFFDKIEQGHQKAVWRKRMQPVIEKGSVEKSKEDAVKWLGIYRKERDEQKAMAVEANNWPHHVYAALQLHYPYIMERYRSDPIQAFKIVFAWEEEFFNQVEDIDREPWRQKLRNTIELTPFGPKLNKKIKIASDKYENVGKESRTVKAMFDAMENEESAENVAKMKGHYSTLMKKYPDRPREAFQIMRKWEQLFMSEMDISEAEDWRARLMPVITTIPLSRVDDKINETREIYNDRKTMMKRYRDAAFERVDGGEDLFITFSTHYRYLGPVYKDEPAMAYEIINRWEDAFFSKINPDDKMFWRKKLEKAISDTKLGPELELKMEKVYVAYRKSKGHM